MPKRVDVLPPLSGPRAIPAGSNLPVLVERRRRADRVGWMALALAILVVVVGGLAARGPIVSAWPATARLYQALGFETATNEALGLRFRNVASQESVESGVPILVITGEIENVSSDPLTVPAIRVGLLDANKQELHHWTFAADSDELAAGRSTAFTTRLTGPPPGATSLSVRFAPNGQG
jgi:hypothetical protein